MTRSRRSSPTTASRDPILRENRSSYHTAYPAFETRRVSRILSSSSSWRSFRPAVCPDRSARTRDDDLTRKTAHFTSKPSTLVVLATIFAHYSRSSFRGNQADDLRGSAETEPLIRSTATATATAMVHGDCRALAKPSRPLIDRRTMNLDLPFLLALYLSSSLFRDSTSPALRPTVASLSLSVTAFRHFLFPRSRRHLSSTES